MISFAQQFHADLWIFDGPDLLQVLNSDKIIFRTLKRSSFQIVHDLVHVDSRQAKH